MIIHTIGNTYIIIKYVEKYSLNATLLCKVLL